MAAGRRRYPVHPRVCGEHMIVRAVTASGGGSSPRVRGTRHAEPAPDRSCRFIPACAGNTRSAPPTAAISPVHPRVCGEHLEGRMADVERDGSSPRVRGTLSARQCRGANRRFIPACAGNTWTPPGAVGPISVHPRVCGEHIEARRHATSPHGSSPRVRGTRLDSDRRAVAPRFIPACAGNTMSRRIIIAPWTVHPRVCGEHRYFPGGTSNPIGSSPRVRGTRHGAGGHLMHVSGSSPRVRGTRASPRVH